MNRRTPRNRWRIVPFFVLSAALHLLLLWIVPSGRDTAGLKVQVLRLPPPALMMPKPTFTADSPRLLQHRLERLELLAGPEFPNPPESIIEVVGDLPVITPFAELAIDTVEVAAKARKFQAPLVEMPDLNKLALRAVRERAKQAERYARFYLEAVTPGTAAYKSRQRAEEIVERAIAAMGGDRALASIKGAWIKMSIEAWDHRQGREVLQVKPYLYPVSNRHYKVRGEVTDISLKKREQSVAAARDGGMRNPAESLSRYYRLFSLRWDFLTPASRQSRQMGEMRRWHFFDRFFGEGVVLRYIQTEKFRDRLTDVIRVDDTLYGNYYEALFSRSTGLLVATRDGLTAAEQRDYSQNYRQKPPVWTTTYEDYETVQGILTPHRIERTGPNCPSCRTVDERTGRSVTIVIYAETTYDIKGADDSLSEGMETVR